MLNNTNLNEYKWLKWSNRIFLILATIMPAFYTLCYFLFIKSNYIGYWEDWEMLRWILFIAPVILLALFMPILGGILILIGVHIGVFYYLMFAFFGAVMWWYFLVPQYFICIIAGLLSLAWGIVRRRERKNKRIIYSSE
jgi:hypothetical protein